MMTTPFDSRLTRIGCSTAAAVGPVGVAAAGAADEESARWMAAEEADATRDERRRVRPKKGAERNEERAIELTRRDMLACLCCDSILSSVEGCTRVSEQQTAE